MSTEKREPRTDAEKFRYMVADEDGLITAHEDGWHEAVSECGGLRARESCADVTTLYFKDTSSFAFERRGKAGWYVLCASTR